MVMRLRREEHRPSPRYAGNRRRASSWYDVSDSATATPLPDTSSGDQEHPVERVGVDGVLDLYIIPRTSQGFLEAFAHRGSAEDAPGGIDRKISEAAEQGPHDVCQVSGRLVQDARGRHVSLLRERSDEGHEAGDLSFRDRGRVDLAYDVAVVLRG